MMRWHGGGRVAMPPRVCAGGDTIRLDIGPKTENVTVASVGTSGARGTGLTLTAPLKFDHAGFQVSQ